MFSFCLFSPVLSPLGLRRRFLLVGHGALTRSFARARIGVGALAAGRESAAMPQSTIGAHLDVTPDVERYLLTEIAFHRAFLFEDVTDVVDFLFRQVADLLVEVDAGAVQQTLGARAADAVNVGEADFSPLLRWQVNARNTCHGPCLLLSLPLLVF